MLTDPTQIYSRTVRVAIVDDDEALRIGISRLARSYGFACATYASGEEFLESADMQYAECLILDIQLPGMDGFAVRDALRERLIDVPIIFISASADLQSLEWRSRSEEAPCLSKPFEGDELMDTICRTLK